MANIGNIIKTGAIVLSAAGGVATTASVVSDFVADETVVVEEYNIEHQHIINVVDTYWINGVEYTAEEWNNYLSNVSGEAKQLYYGAVDSYTDFTLADLDTKDIISSTNEYNVSIDADNQYTLFAVPTEFEIAAIKCSGYSIDFAELTTLSGYTVYSQPDEYDVWNAVSGDYTYSIYLK